MSIWNTLYTGSSGINAFGNGLQVVGDNIANVNTTGFKAGRAQFEAMLGGTSVGGQRVGNGVRMNGSETLFGAGSIQQSDRGLDLAINGGGFFAVRDPSSGMTSYTRDGQFALDGSGFLVGKTGRVQAFGTSASGAINPIAGDLQLDPVSRGIATTMAEMRVQLDHGATAPANGFDETDPDTYNFATQVSVTDSLGGQHDVTLYFIATAPGEWDWRAMVDGGEVGGTPGVAADAGTGSLTFDESGALVAQAGSITADFAGAVAGQVIEVNFGSDTTNGGDGSGSRSVSTASASLEATANGSTASTLQDVRVSEDGSIIAMYRNGSEAVVGAMAIAQVPVESAMARSANQSFLATFDSGEPILGRASEGNRGQVIGSALEASNVDLSNELVTMIAYQRAFQSNARTITTADEMLQEVTNLKR